MGVVFQAEDPRLGRLCAVKAMLPRVASKPGMKERFLREARAAAQVEHDHIIPVYQVDEDRGVPYIAMPFLKGMSLEDWIRKEQKVNPGGTKVAEILSVGLQIASGLAAAHERGLIHRDIKPANIWLDASASGRVKILDFGLARLSENAGEQDLTPSGAIVGTPAYMAPEQARGERLDARADLFSLGVILYRLCTGRLPFLGKDLLSTLTALAKDTPAAPHWLNPAVPQPLSELVMKLLEKEADNRMASAHDVLKAIQAIQQGCAESEAAPTSDSPVCDIPPTICSDVQAPRASVKGDAKRRSPRKPIIALAAAALVAMTGIVLLWQTPHGTVRVEINDEKIIATFDKTGLRLDGAGKKPIRIMLDDKRKDTNTLPSGEHWLTVQRDDLKFRTRSFHLAGRGETVLKIELLDGVVKVSHDGLELGREALPKSSRETPFAPVARWPLDAEQARLHQEAWANHLGVPVEIENSLGMKLRLIPPGEFLIGMTQADVDRNTAKTRPVLINHRGNVVPPRLATIEEPFYLGVCEVTQKAWRDIMGTNPSINQRYDDLPVENISWFDGIAFCNRLSEREGRRPWYRIEGTTVEPIVWADGYRLPDIDQWQHACRAGSGTRYFFGDDPAPLGDYDWFSENSSGSTQPVGRKRPNPFGLCDLYGNVMEMVQQTKNRGKFGHQLRRGGECKHDAHEVFVWAAAATYAHDRDQVLPKVGLRVLLPVSSMQSQLAPVPSQQAPQAPTGSKES
jgi:serine/threonine protein kinase/formylglycine-generating enzyme required for sulfatase activity